MIIANNVDIKTTWISFSVGKSVTSILLGIALKESAVKSLDRGFWPQSRFLPYFIKIIMAQLGLDRRGMQRVCLQKG